MHSQKYSGNKCMGICGAKAKDTHVPFKIMTSSQPKKLINMRVNKLLPLFLHLPNGH